MNDHDENCLENVDNAVNHPAHADWRAKILFDFLQLSPSYRLAYLLRSNKIRRDMDKVPKCITQILDMYDIFGSVWDTNFEEFWNVYNKSINVSPDNNSPVEMIAKINNKSFTDSNMFTVEHNKLYKFTNSVIYKREIDNVLVLSIDINDDRTEILKSLKRIIDAEIPMHKIGSGKKVFKFAAGKLRKNTLQMALTVVRTRTLFPDVPLYVIGNEAGVSPENYTENYAARNETDSKARRLMEILTSRHLKRAFIIAENAALGHFPSFDPLPDELSNGRFDMYFLRKKFAKSWEIEIA